MQRCGDCGEIKPDVRSRACGYQVEINDADPDVETETICDDCEQEHLDDI